MTTTQATPQRSHTGIPTSVRAAPLIDCKRVVSELIADLRPPIVYVQQPPPVARPGNARPRLPHGLGGRDLQAVDGPLSIAGRGESWIKVMCATRGTFTVVGYPRIVIGLRGQKHRHPLMIDGRDQIIWVVHEREHVELHRGAANGQEQEAHRLC